MQTLFIKSSSYFTNAFSPPRWLNGRALTLNAEDRDSIPGRVTPKSLKRVVTALLANASQYKRVLHVYSVALHR